MLVSQKFHYKLRVPKALHRGVLGKDFLYCGKVTDVVLIGILQTVSKWQSVFTFGMLLSVYVY